MSKERVWNEDTRFDLKENLRFAIVGQLRLAKLGHAEIIDFCREVYVVEDSPPSEHDDLMRFVADEINRSEEVLTAEKATWPVETDCDRLDRVETTLRGKGILLWQASPCCDTCSGSELPDRIDVIEQRYPGFRDSLRGYSFFIDQNMPDMLAEGTLDSVCLAYGWFSPEDSKVSSEEYVANALKIAHEVCGCLRDEGFKPVWDGTIGRKICFPITWQRRANLE